MTSNCQRYNGPKGVYVFCTVLWKSLWPSRVTEQEAKRQSEELDAGTSVWVREAVAVTHHWCGGAVAGVPCGTPTQLWWGHPAHSTPRGVTSAQAPLFRLLSGFTWLSRTRFPGMDDSRELISCSNASVTSGSDG